MMLSSESSVHNVFFNFLLIVDGAIQCKDKTLHRLNVFV